MLELVDSALGAMVFVVYRSSPFYDQVNPPSGPRILRYFYRRRVIKARGVVDAVEDFVTGNVVFIIGIDLIVFGFHINSGYNLGLAIVGGFR
ncbi:hypothetical protein [Stygiolobus caldivivus]|uniref:Uncharacterized protein n=1 Tax=Stygiolobus caldivivus TaxID=2824673 RepID=A0A8D5U5S1_9CREN|nr:hypothetical protein [Stygiolobus caldivivus]BCU69828.1 hypothetical protein KN1_11250 [Stygiolobus caldivivus]